MEFRDIRIKARHWEDRFIDLNFIPRIGDFLQLYPEYSDYEFEVIKVIIKQKEFDETGIVDIILECEEYRINEE